MYILYPVDIGISVVFSTRSSDHVLYLMQRIYGTMCTAVYTKDLWYNVYQGLCKRFMVQCVQQFMQRVYDTMCTMVYAKGVYGTMCTAVYAKGLWYNVYCSLCKGFMVQSILQFMQMVYGTICTAVYTKGLWYNLYCSLGKGFMVQSVLQFIQRVYDTTLLCLCSYGRLFSQTSLSVYSCTCFHSATSCALKVDSRRLFCTCSVIKMALLSFVSPLPAE